MEPGLTISLKTLTQLGLAGFAGLLVLAYGGAWLFAGDTGLLSIQGLLVTLESLVLCMLLVSYCNRIQLGLVAFFLLLMGIYYWIPVINLIVFPENFFRGNVLPYDIGRGDVDVALTFLAVAFPLSLLALMAGPPTQALRSITIFRSPVTAMRAYWSATIVMLASSALELYRYLIVGQGRFGEGATGGLNRIYYLVTEFQLVCIIFLAAAVSAWPLLGRRGKALFVVTLTAYALTRTFTGSKGSIFEVFIFGAGIVLMASELNRIKVKLVVALVAAAVVLFPLSFMAGFVTRAVSFGGELRSEAIAVEDIYETGMKTYGDQGELFSPLNIVKRMAGRVNAFDVLVLVVRKGTDVKLDFWDTVPKAIVNLVMPGDPYGEVLASSRLFLMEYADQTEETAFRIYHTDVWYVFGVFIPFVGLLGALLLIVLSLRAFGAWYYRTFRSLERWRFYSLASMFYCFYWLLTSLGIDEWVGIVMKAAVNLLVFIAAMRLLERWMPHSLLYASSRPRLGGSAAAGA